MQHIYCDECGEKTFFDSIFPKRCSDCGFKFGSFSNKTVKPTARPVKKPKFEEEEEFDLDIDEEAIRASIVWDGERIKPMTLGDAKIMGPVIDSFGPRSKQSLDALKQDVSVRKVINIG